VLHVDDLVEASAEQIVAIFAAVSVAFDPPKWKAPRESYLEFKVNQKRKKTTTKSRILANLVT
jgi:hypothetical protein